MVHRAWRFTGALLCSTALLVACGDDGGGSGGTGGETSGAATSGGSTSTAGSSSGVTTSGSTTAEPGTGAPTTGGDSSSGGSSGGGGTTGGGAVAPVLLTITLHLENKTFDAAYFASLDAFAATFEAHGGRLTFEPRDQVVTAAAGPPVLFDWKALEARGHSIGSHAAIGGTQTTPLDTFTAQAKMRHDHLAPYVDRLDHISGNCGAVDWVTGVVAAGFKATTAATVLCLYSMDPADWPDPYKDLACAGPTDPVCHQSYPEDLPARMHPWRAKSGADWLTDDPAGQLVVIPGSGTLPCLAEEANNPGGTLPSCTLTAEDVTLALADLDAAIALADPDLVNTFYWVWGSWAITPAEQPVLEDFLAAVDERVAAGTVQWASVGGILDAYAAWVQAHP